MKDYQFEEITFWLSFISCLISYHLGIEWLTGILVVVTALNLFWSIVTAWKDLKKERNNQSKNESNNRKEES
jgi:NADH:ubiquinone oxidoreductase subunit 4 (subunit M)